MLKSARNPTFGVRGSALHTNPNILMTGRRVGRGPSEALESAEIGRSIRHASDTPQAPLCETGAADPNAPSGASTAAAYFEDRRLLQLIAYCSLQIIDRSFDLCVFVCV